MKKPILKVVFLFRTAFLIPALCLFFCALNLDCVGSLSKALKPRQIDGYTYVSLKRLAAYFSMKIEHADSGFTLRNRWNRLEFVEKSRKCLINQTLVWLHEPLLKNGRNWYLSQPDLDYVLDPVLRADNNLKGHVVRTVILDPGHGGNDPGALGKLNVQEKQIVLDLAKRIRVHLVNKGIKVCMSRENDRALTLTNRVKTARDTGSHLFVSLHLNSSSNTKAAGVETYVMTLPGYHSTNTDNKGRIKTEHFAGNAKNQHNAAAGYYIQRYMQRKLGVEDRGVRRARFYVLKHAPCPAVLVEAGFITHPPEETRLLKDEYREKIAAGISAGIMEYIRVVTRANLAQ